MTTSVEMWLHERREFEQEMEEVGVTCSPTSFLDYQVWRLARLLQAVTHLQEDEQPDKRGCFGGVKEAVRSHLRVSDKAVAGAWWT